MAVIDNLLEHWSLDNTRAGTLGAITISAVGGGGADEAAGVNGRCLSYPGTSGRFDQFTYSSAIPQGTIAFRWKSQGDGTGNFHRVFAKTQVGVTDRLIVGLTNFGRRPLLTLSDTTIVSETLDTLTRDLWYSHVITWNGSIVKWYINGIEAYSVNTTVTLLANAQPFTLGGWSGNSTQQGNGDLDDPAIWLRALTASEALLYHQNAYPFEAPATPSRLLMMGIG